METSSETSVLEDMIKREKKKYGKAFGRLSGTDIIGAKPLLAELLIIAERYKTLVELRDKEAVKEALPASTEPEESEGGLPDGICNSESCTDEFCVEYWEEVENADQ